MLSLGFTGMDCGAWLTLMRYVGTRILASRRKAGDGCWQVARAVAAYQSLCKILR